MNGIFVKPSEVKSRAKHVFKKTREGKIVKRKKKKGDHLQSLFPMGICKEPFQMLTHL